MYNMQHYNISCIKSVGGTKNCSVCSNKTRWEKKEGKNSYSEYNK